MLQNCSVKKQQQNQKFSRCMENNFSKSLTQKLSFFFFKSMQYLFGKGVAKDVFYIQRNFPLKGQQRIQKIAHKKTKNKSCSEKVTQEETWLV